MATTFGKLVSKRRQELKMSQVELAGKIRKSDGGSISAQYLNDIEHERRKPPSDELLEQFAEALDVSYDYLSALAGRLQIDISKEPPEKVDAAFEAFRKTLKNEDQ